MPPYDYDYLIGAARGGDQRAKLLLDYLAANKRVNSFINSGSYQYSPVIEDVTVSDDANDVDIDSGNVDDIYKDIYKDINGQGSRNDWMSGALAVGNGLTSIFNTTRDMSHIADTSRQRSMIQDIGNIGTSKYGNYQQAISDINRIDSMQPNLSLDTIRGHSTKEQIGGVLSNVVTGATTGAQVGGPYGAFFGGLAGGAAGAWGIVSNNLDAKAERSTDTAMLANALDRSNINIAAGIEDLQNDTHRNKIYNLGAKGGKIQRKRTPIKAEKVKGGIKIRIKR